MFFKWFFKTKTMNTQKREQKETTHTYQTNTVSLCRSMDVSRDEGTGFEATEGVAGVLRGRSEARAARQARELSRKSGADHLTTLIW